MQWRWHVQLLFHKTRKAVGAQRQSALSDHSISLLKREIVGQLRPDFVSQRLRCEHLYFSATLCTHAAQRRGIPCGGAQFESSPMGSPEKKFLKETMTGL
jgi:hypothetical protein